VSELVCRLAAVQDKRPVSVPLINSRREVSDDDRRSLMTSITALLPDHAARLQALQVSHTFALTIYHSLSLSLKT